MWRVGGDNRDKARALESPNNKAVFGALLYIEQKRRWENATNIQSSGVNQRLDTICLGVCITYK
jgi:hypothetical protein